MFCTNCGQEQVAGARFCGNCGTAIVQAPGSKLATSYTNVVEYAGFWRRFGAAFFDAFLLGAIGLPVGFAIGFVLGSAGADETTIGLVAYAAAIVIVLVYYPVMESSSKQATLGKMAFRIIVTDDKGQRISLGRAVARYFAKLISALILYIGFIMIAFTPKKQGLHDMIAGTLVLLK